MLHTVKTIAPQVPQFSPRIEAAGAYAIREVIERTGMRLRALTTAYETECTRIKGEMLTAIKNIERE